MDTEKWFYAQVVMIRQKNSDNKKGKEEEKTKKYTFQEESAISIRLFDLDHEWLKETFRTREPDFYKKLLSKHIRGQQTKKNNMICSSNW